MILDSLENLTNYLCLAKGFAEAAAFLARKDLHEFADGKHEIDGECVFAAVSRNVGRSREGARLEVHKRYIDIQVVLSGIDTMGWMPANRCCQPDGPYAEDRDVLFYNDDPSIWLPVTPGSFVVFFPGEAHLPSISTEPLDKIVVKILTD